MNEKTNAIPLKIRKPTGYITCAKGWPGWASTPKLTGELRPAKRCLGTEQSSWPHQCPQCFTLLPLESVPFAQKGLANQMEKTRAAAVNHGPLVLSQSGIQGPGPPAHSSLHTPSSQESCPPPIPSLAPEQSKLCVQGWHCSLWPPRANTRPTPGTARPHSPSWS